MNAGSPAGMALVCVGAAAAGFAAQPGFGATDLLLPVSAAAVVPVVVTAAVSRGTRRPPPLPVSVAATALAWCALSAALLFDDAGGIGARVVAAGRALVDGWARLLDTTLPAPPAPELLLVPATLTWVAAFTGAELLVRTRARLWPLAPAAVAFVLAVVLTVGGPGTSLVPAAVLVAAAALLVLARREASPGTDAGTPAGAGAGGVAGGLALVCAATALAAGPALPVVDATPYDPREGRALPIHPYPALNPLGELAGWLADSPERVLFTISSSQPHSMVRLAVLDTYDGALWTSSERFVRSGGRVPRPDTPDTPDAAAPEPGSTVVRQDIQILDLGGHYLPAVDRPEHVSLPASAHPSSALRLAVGPDTGVLVAPDGVKAGHRFTVTSRPTAEHPASQLVAARVPSGPATWPLTDLPEGVPQEIRDLVELAADGATAPFVRAAQVERYLRHGGFTYDPTAPAGHAYGHIHHFLSRTHRGTPEQFATTFALAMRTMHLPSRIVVGFSTAAAGSADGVREVRAEDATVWAEVLFAESGWMAFYPTPEDAAGGGDAADSVGAELLERDRELDEALDTPVTLPPEVTPPVTRPAPDGGGTPVAAWVVPLAAVVPVAAYLAVAALRPRLRRYRRRRADSPRERVLGAWDDCLDSFASIGSPVSPAATPSEVVAAGAALARRADPNLTPLAIMFGRAAYAPDGVSEASAETAWEWADRVRRHLESAVPRRRVLISRLRPGTVLARSARPPAVGSAQEPVARSARTHAGGDGATTSFGPGRRTATTAKQYGRDGSSASTR